MNNEVSIDSKEVKVPVLIWVFNSILIVGVIFTLIRFLSLVSNEGFEYVYFELGYVIVVNIPLCYGIVKRKPWARILAVWACLISFLLAVSGKNIYTPAILIAVFRDIPFALYFLFSKNAKKYFVSQE